MPEPHTALKELMLADLVRFEEAVWKNEEIGEKRFNFFMTLLTAAAAGLVALWATERANKEEFQKSLTLLTQYAAFTLLIFGLVSYRRMVHRDKVTAEYKKTANGIRRTYRSVFGADSAALVAYKLEFEIKNEEEASRSSWRRRFKRIKQMGYTQTLAVMNGVLLMLAVKWSGAHYGLSVALGLTLAVILCLVGSTPHEVHSPDPVRAE